MYESYLLCFLMKSFSHQSIFKLTPFYAWVRYNLIAQLRSRSSPENGLSNYFISSQDVACIVDCNMNDHEMQPQKCKVHCSVNHCEMTPIMSNVADAEMAPLRLLSHRSKLVAAALCLSMRVGNLYIEFIQQLKVWVTSWLEPRLNSRFLCVCDSFIITYDERIISIMTGFLPGSISS